MKHSQEKTPFEIVEEHLDSLMGFFNRAYQNFGVYIGPDLKKGRIELRMFGDSNNEDNIPTYLIRELEFISYYALTELFEGQINKVYDKIQTGLAAFSIAKGILFEENVGLLRKLTESVRGKLGEVEVSRDNYCVSRYPEAYLGLANEYLDKWQAYNAMDWDAPPQKREDVLRERGISA